MRFWLTCLMLAMATVVGVGVTDDAAYGAPVVPDGFVDEHVLDTDVATGFDFLPDGRMIMGRKQGYVEIRKADGSFETTAVDLKARTCVESERGLASVVLDPQFATNRYFYVFYTHKRSDCSTSALTGAVNRITRFTLGADNRAVSGSEVVLIDGIANPGNAHIGGDMAFGKDGYLYASSGDGMCHYQTLNACANANTAARDMHVLNGKMIRITRDGQVPADNPFRGANSRRCNTGRVASGQQCQEIYATGLRNPFRIAMDPNSAATRFLINDVGGGKWEEIDEGVRGADYGWNVREGHCKLDSYTDCPQPSGYREPIHDYRHDGGCSSITGGAFIPAGAWPAPYSGSYLFADYVCGKIFRLAPKAGGGYTSEPFMSELGNSSAVNFEWGPAPGGGALYYSNFANGGEIRRVRFVGNTNRDPEAKLSATPRSGALPLQVTFDAGASSDPDGDPLTYEFDFGDGSETQTTTSPTVQHTYATRGAYSASVRVSDGHGNTSAPASVEIQAGNQAPEISLESPSPSYRFSVGDNTTARVAATDAEDGELPDGKVATEMLLHHNDHTHPFRPLTIGKEVSFTTPAPEDLAAATTSFLRLHVTATDSEGASTTASFDIRPKLVPFALDSSPPGAEMTANGVRVTAPAYLQSWPGYVINLSTPTSIRGGLYTFRQWRDLVKQPTRTVTTAAQGDYYQSQYKLAGVP